MDKNKFAVTPPMGWNSYDYYDTTVNEAEVRANAEFMAKNLKQYGWEYVVIDIEWYSNDAGTQRQKHQYIPFGDDEIDEYSRFQPSPSRFPSSNGGKGFALLAEYIHSLGLKFGIHIMRGIPRCAAERHLKILGTTATANEVANPQSICGWNPDMYGVHHNADGQAYYDSIVKMYADWCVDFIKCDDICDSWMYGGDYFSGWEETKMLHRAIEKSGREIVLSLSPGPAHIDRAWHYAENANMWRITDDFWDRWEHLKNMFWRCEMWQDHVREGCWPDCDMLPLGKLGKGHGHEWTCNFTPDEQRTMITLWSLFRSPMMIGAELTMADDTTLSLLTNENVLAMLSDGRGVQIRRNNTEAVWKSVGESSVRVALFNLSDSEKTVKVEVSDIAENIDLDTQKELWGEAAAEIEGGVVKAIVPTHGVRIYSFSKK